MSSENKSQKVNIAVAFSTAIISFLILIPVATSIRIPFGKSNVEIVSPAILTNISPYTNYVKFLILLIIPSLVAIITLNTKQKLISKYWTTINKYRTIITGILQKTFTLLGNARFYTIFISILIFSWAINKNYSDLDWTLVDAFHEGEYLGFLPNFLTLEKPFLRSFMIHGFGLDALTSLMASSFANYSNTVALTRFFRMTQGLIGYLGCYWIIWELVLSFEFNNRKHNVFLLSSILFTVFDGIFFKFFTDMFAGRDTFFILQLALIIRFFRIADSSKNKIAKLILPVLIGASIPFSFFYVYDRAAYFLIVYLFAYTLSVCFKRRFFSSLLSGSIVGLTTASVLIIVVIGFDQASEVLLQVWFWVRYGRYISFNPLPSPSIGNPESLLIWFRFSFSILTQILAIIYLVSDYKKNSGLGLKTFLKNKCLLIILLFASLIYMRIALDRPNNSDYVGSGSLFSVLLLIYLGLNIFKTYFEEQTSKWILESSLKHLIVTSIALIILSHPVLNPFLALIKLGRLSITYKAPDIEVVKPDFWQTYDALKPEVSQLSCFFTLNQEGFWYYLFNKPSCSKFGIIYYARTINAQETVIHEVKTRKPNIILFGPTNYVNALEGIPVSDSIPIVYRYFLNHYKPYVVVESQWFWKKSDEKLVFKNDESYTCCGSIDTVLGETILQGDNASLSGVAMLPNHSKVADAVYVSYGKNNQLVEVTKVDKNSKWTVPIPTLSLPIGKGVFRVWSYDAEGSQLMQIGQDINVNLVAR